MARLYVTEQGASLGFQQGQLRVTLGEHVLSSTPFSCVDAISLFGNIGVSTPLLHRCLQRDCRVAFFSRAGRYRGALVPPVSRNIPLRIAQVRLSQDPGFAVRIAAILTETKIRNARRFLKRQAWNAREVDIDRDLALLDRLARECRSRDSPKALRATEARAARVYFAVLGRLVASKTSFYARIRRPPRGIMNVLLSLGYSMLSDECAAALEAAGLDPFIGVLHALRYGRASLALDLVEEFRTPVAERLAVSLLMRDCRDFREDAEPVTLLGKPALDRFFSAYERRMTTAVTERGRRITCRQAIHRQAGRLADCFRANSTAYVPFLYR
jgi:CRISPR-associated protein Cas1